MNKMKFDKTNIAELNSFLLGIISIILIGLVLKPMRTFMVPIILSILIYLLFKPILVFLKKHRIPKFLAVIITLIILFLVMQSLGMIIYASLSSFVEEFPHYEKRVVEIYFSAIEKLNLKHEDVLNYDWESQIPTLSITKVVANLFGSVMSFFSKFLLVVMIVLYFFMGEGNFEKKINKIFRGDGEVLAMVKTIHHQVYSYLLTKTIISLITGIFAWAVLTLYGVDFPIVWGVLTFLLNYIPSVGSLIATVFPVTISLVQFGDFVYPFWILITLASVQFVLGNIVEPKCMGENLNMSPVTVLIALIFWGWIWGAQGMFIGVPLTAVIKIICENIPSLRFIAVLMSNK